jgi:adenosylcobinamide-GDP ribazoletransferase
VSGPALAIRYLTILPLPGGADTRHGLGRAAAWFPVVGLALGLLLAGVDWATSRVFPPLLSAGLTVAAWKILTGGLHLDGLADCLDGLAGRDREHRLAIMRDSRIGTFGAIGLVLLLMLAGAAVAAVPSPERWRVLLASPAIGRAMPVVLARLFGAARSDGQGAVFIGSVRPMGALLAMVVALAVTIVALGPAGVAALLLALAATIAAGAFLARRLGGLTGDVLGAVVELAELTVLLAVVGWRGAPG